MPMYTNPPESHTLYSRSEGKVLDSLISGPKRWTDLLRETGLSKRALSRVLHELTKRNEVKEPATDSPTDHRYKLADSDPMAIAILRQMLATLPALKLELSWVDNIEPVVKEVLERGQSLSETYLRLNDLLNKYDESMLEMSTNQIKWASHCLLSGDREGYRQIRKAAKENLASYVDRLLDLAEFNPFIAYLLIRGRIDAGPDDELLLEDDYLREKVFESAAAPIRNIQKLRERVLSQPFVKNTTKRQLKQFEKQVKNDFANWYGRTVHSIMDLKSFRTS